LIGGSLAECVINCFFPFLIDRARLEIIRQREERGAQNHFKEVKVNAKI
jgi:hypothetical protein